MRLPPDARIGRVDLTVHDLEGELKFYETILGLRVLDRQGNVAHLGTDTPIVALHEDATAIRRPRSAAGLYHMAILVPTRAALGGVLRRLVDHRWPLEGASDHHVSEALYLSDAEGNGIEVYADRPRSVWQHDGKIHMTTGPMDVQSVIAEAPAAAAPPPGTIMGHVHLQVGDVPTAEAWYRETLGLDLTARYGGQASFLSVGGYHHHLGMNAWQSRGAPPAKDGETGLKSYTFAVPGLHKAHEARDPAGNLVLMERL